MLDRVVLRTALTVLAAIGFAYVALHEYAYWTNHDHIEVAALIAILGASGVLLAAGQLIRPH